jgi:hypothetical protein
MKFVIRALKSYYKLIRLSYCNMVAYILKFTTTKFDHIAKMIVQVARVARFVRLRHFSSAASGSPTIVYDPVSHIVSSPLKIEVSPLNLPDYLWRNLSSVESKPAIVRYIYRFS